jgi:hypothetical protein
MRPRHIVYLMANAVIAASLIVFAVAMGWVGFTPIFGAVLLGLALAWPASLLVAKWIKLDDPAWNATTRNRPVRAELTERLQHGFDPLRPRPPNPLEAAPRR